MSLSMYELSIPVFVRMLENISNILEKAVKHAEAKKIDLAVFVNARLAPDMFALARQIQIASDTAKGCGARLAGIDIPSFADTETSFSELQDRIQKTLNFLKGLNAQQFEDSENRKVDLKLGEKEVHFSGLQYLTGFVLPNFYFHISMAYAILREQGVEIGKKDYLRGL